MIAASKEFKEKLKNGANLVNYADITLSDGQVLHLTYKDFMIGGCQIEDKTTDGNFGIGYVIGKTLSIKLENKDGRFSGYDFYQSIIHIYVAMMLEDGTIEKIKKGVFYTVVPETPGDIIDISAVDGMYLLDKDYSYSSTTYPATLQTIISNACIDCGIPIGFRQFDNMNYVVNDKPESVTYRQIFSYACQIAGYNAHIDTNGYMQLIWYNSDILDRYNYNGGNFKKYKHETVIDGGNFTDYSKNTIISAGNFIDKIPEHIFRIKSLNISTDDVYITGVKVIGDDKKEVLFGEEGYVIEVSGNPFANQKEHEVANYLGARIVGMSLRPFSAKIIGNPLYEPFEVVRVSDRKGNVYNSVINSVSYKIGGYTQVSCEAEDPVRNGSRYMSPSAQAVVESRRDIKKQITNYDKAVQNMNQLAANSMGLYRETEQQDSGGDIYYQSNRPITVDSNGKCHFESGSVVYKSASDGFFVSVNGGESYTSGFDSNGNAVFNVLAAIGITFDWAHGGTLTLGGSGNGNGRLNIMNASGSLIGYIDNTGVHFNQGVFSGSLSAAKGTFNGIVSAGRVVGSQIEGSLIKTYDADGLNGIEIEAGKQRFYYEGNLFGYMEPQSDVIINESNGSIVEIPYLYFSCPILYKEVSGLSDERKKNISKWNDKYDDFLMDLVPVEFSWKEGKDKRINTGFGAQTVKKLLKKHGLINNALVSGRDETEYSIAYSNLHAIEINSIQKNREMIQELKELIFELKNIIGSN